MHPRNGPQRDNNQKVHEAVKIEVTEEDKSCQYKRKLCLAWCTHDTSDNQGGDANYRWTHNPGVDSTTYTIEQIIHEYETCTAIKQARWLKPL